MQLGKLRVDLFNTAWYDEGEERSTVSRLEASERHQRVFIRETLVLPFSSDFNSFRFVRGSDAPKAAIE
jgi:hypothetical protein